MAHAIEQIGRWSAVDGCGPAEKMFGRTKHHDHDAVAWLARPDAIVDAETAGATRHERGRRRDGAADAFTYSEPSRRRASAASGSREAFPRSARYFL